MARKLIRTYQQSQKVIERLRHRTNIASSKGEWIKIEDLPDYLARHGLKVVGGDPDLHGYPWEPKLYMVPVEGDSVAEGMPPGPE